MIYYMDMKGVENLTFKAIRTSLNMSQAQFCETFGNIPLSTYQHWEQGISVPPKYVSNLIAHRYKNMMKDDEVSKNEET